MATNTPLIAVAVVLAVAGAGGWLKYFDERDSIGELSQEFEQRSAQLTADVETTQLELSAAEQQLVDTQAQIVALETAVRTSRETAENTARIEIESLVVERDVLAAERDELVARLEQLVGERDMLVGERNTLVGERDTLVVERDILIGEHEVLVVERDGLIAERDILIGEREMLAVELGVIAAKHDHLDADNKTLIAERDRLVAERDELATLNQAFSAELERLHMVQFEARQRARLLGEELLMQENLAAAQQKRLTQELAAARGSEQATREELERMRRAFEKLAENEALVAQLSSELRESSTDIGALEAELARLEEEARLERERFAVLNTQLQGELSSRDVQVRQLENRLTMIRVGSDILFQSGSIELTENGRQALALIAEALNEYPDRKVDVEGHTDDVPIGAALREVFPTNWELSAARAAQAVRFLHARGVDPARLRVVGLGEYQPVAANQDVESRARNRRIEFTMLPVAQRVVSAGN